MPTSSVNDPLRGPAPPSGDLHAAEHRLRTVDPHVLARAALLLAVHLTRHRYRKRALTIEELNASLAQGSLPDDESALRADAVGFLHDVLRVAGDPGGL